MRIHENYENRYGLVLSQIKRQPFQYTETYSAIRYNTPETLKKGPLLARIRERIILDHTEFSKDKTKVLDVGYGNGTFLRHLRDSGWRSLYGNDISGYRCPTDVTVVDDIFNQEFNVVTFWDVLEHFPDPSVIKDLKTDYIGVSLPWCHWMEMGVDWFANWKHRKPDEHLHHFNHLSLPEFFNTYGYDCVYLGNPEDQVRKINSTLPNILTGFFKRRTPND